MLAEALLITSLSLSAPMATDYTNTTSLPQCNLRPQIRVVSYYDKKNIVHLSGSAGKTPEFDLSLTPLADTLTEIGDSEFTIPRQVKAKFAVEFNITKVVKKKAHLVFD